jgi:hypothetical protein
MHSHAEYDSVVFLVCIVYASDSDLIRMLYTYLYTCANRTATVQALLARRTLLYMMSPFDITTSNTAANAQKGCSKLVEQQQQDNDKDSINALVDTSDNAAVDNTVEVQKPAAAQVQVQAFAEPLETSFTIAYINVFNALSLSYTGRYCTLTPIAAHICTLYAYIMHVVNDIKLRCEVLTCVVYVCYQTIYLTCTTFLTCYCRQ